MNVCWIRTISWYFIDFTPGSFNSVFSMYLFSSYQGQKYLISNMSWVSTSTSFSIFQIIKYSKVLSSSNLIYIMPDLENYLSVCGIFNILWKVLFIDKLHVFFKIWHAKYFSFHVGCILKCLHTYALLWQYKIRGKCII